ncbi:hypothetical protein [Evansella tamaricis]|uniref:Uncharacterized protein n=1 Tax=Evansella tamaricis TaxID=2069301 RepID=A0ABS6JBF1_9BACI|nr:hypothetical protein [Evansella tamaricis]MBU9710876.1 hypothetical protein [Evansella tamaricis]
MKSLNCSLYNNIKKTYSMFVGENESFEIGKYSEATIKFLEDYRVKVIPRENDIIIYVIYQTTLTEYNEPVENTWWSYIELKQEDGQYKIAQLTNQYFNYGFSVDFDSEVIESFSTDEGNQPLHNSYYEGDKLIIEIDLSPYELNFDIEAYKVFIDEDTNLISIPFYAYLPGESPDRDTIGKALKFELEYPDTKGYS